jgi:hypothetical protein
VQVRHRYLIPLLGPAATAVGIAAAPPAAADCVDGGGVILCSQGDTRVSNRTPLAAATPYVRYPCDLDWMCDQGLGLALGD